MMCVLGLVLLVLLLLGLALQDGKLKRITVNLRCRSLLDRRTGKCKGTPMTMPTWKERAERARQEGYLPGNGWERMLERSLRRTRPNLVAELEQSQSLPEYLQVMTHNAMNLAERLEDQGAPPEVAREMAMQQLLNLPD